MIIVAYKIYINKSIFYIRGYIPFFEIIINMDKRGFTFTVIYDNM